MSPVDDESAEEHHRERVRLAAGGTPGGVGAGDGRDARCVVGDHACAVGDDPRAAPTCSLIPGRAPLEPVVEGFVGAGEPAGAVFR